MLKVGITGGIGSGKSMVCRVFTTLGIPVYYADDRAKSLMNHDDLIREKVKELFGEESYTNEGLNRKFIADIIFSQPEKREQLNALTHPVIINDGIKWMQQQTTPYALKEAALLFESGSYQQLDYIIGVSAPLALRLQRTIIRDAKTEEHIKKIMAQQMHEEEKMKRCDFIIYNDEQNSILKQVWALHQHLLKI